MATAWRTPVFAAVVERLVAEERDDGERRDSYRHRHTAGIATGRRRIAADPPTPEKSTSSANDTP